MGYKTFVKKNTTVNLILAAILIVLGLIKSGNWMSDWVYVICGGTQLISTILIPLRTKGVEDEKALAELFVQQNWVILALGMAGTCTYLAPFVAPVNLPALAYIAFVVGIITLLFGVYSMVVTKKETGIDLMV